jgi:AcrR family transcriptional regulator
VTGTRSKLLNAAIATLRDKGIAGTSARVIATAAGVNQALVFYHFGSVAELINEACREAAAQQVEHYRPQFARAASLDDLLTLGRQLHAWQRDAGNVAVLAQVLAGARSDPSLAAAARQALTVWISELETTLERLLRTSPISEMADTAGLARAVAAAFVGIELYEGADPDGAESAFAALAQLSALIKALDGLGPAARRALHNRLRRTATARSPSRPASWRAAGAREPCGGQP